MLFRDSCFRPVFRKRVLKQEFPGLCPLTQENSYKVFTHTRTMQDFDAAKHQELNLYFKQKIKELLESHPQLANRTNAGESLELNEIVECMTLNDQLRWKEFLALDQQKMNLDLQNHLEGKGDPLHSKEDF